MTTPTTTELVPVDNGSREVAAYLSPEAAIIEAEAAATAFNRVIQKRRAQLITNIKGRDHIKIEGWLTLGTLAAALFRGPITPYEVWVRPVADKDGVLLGYEARCEARCGDRVLTAAEAACLFAEGNWKGRDDFAVRSMAQTRAASKAMAFALRWVMVLAGYEGTPAEEMPSDRQPPVRRPAAPTPRTVAPAEEAQPSPSTETVDREPAPAATTAPLMQAGAEFQAEVIKELNVLGIKPDVLCDFLGCTQNKALTMLRAWIAEDPENRTVRGCLEAAKAKAEGGA